MRKMFCGNFSERIGKKLSLDDVDGRLFIKALDVWCGRKDCQEVEIGEVPLLASVADRFQMTEVTSVLEEALIGQLSLEVCGDVLVWSGQCGMQQLEAHAIATAAKRLEEFAKTEGFARMGEEALAKVVDDDRLVAMREEAVWEAVVGWMEGGAGVGRGREVVGKIRFPLMAEDYLRDRLVEAARKDDQEWMAGVVAEALRAKAALREGAVVEFDLLGRKALEDRVGLGVRWEDYREGGELRLGDHDDYVMAIAACEGWMCSGSQDLPGSIQVWSRATGEHARTLLPDANEEDVGPDEGVLALAVWEGRLISGHERTLRTDANELEDDEEADGSVLSLAVWEGRLISGHESGRLRVWNVATGECGQVLAQIQIQTFELARIQSLNRRVCAARSSRATTRPSVRWPCGDRDSRAAPAAGPSRCGRWRQAILGRASGSWPAK